MKTSIQVEEYTTELAPEVIQQLAADGETLLLIEELGLAGQQSLYKSKDTGEPVKVHPYRQITAEEFVVFEACFPEKTKLEDYNLCPIPLRVLQIVSHVRSLEQDDMQYLEVWHPRPGNVDPILVARKTKYQSPIFLLARWGSSLLPFATLRDKAIDIITTKAEVKLQQAQQSISNNLLNLKDIVKAKVLDGQAYSPYISID